MLRFVSATLALILLVDGATSPAAAQSFLEKLARQAADKAVEKATDAVMNGGGSDNSRGDEDDDTQAGQVLTPKPRATAAAPAPAPAAPPARAKAPKPPAYPGGITVSAEIKAKIEAFDQFGRVSCNDCEGGRSYDSWAQRFFNGELMGEYNGWAKKLGNLNVGDRLTWKGQASNGSLAVISEAPVEGFRCKQLTYRLDKPNAFAERPGLVCWGKLNQYSSNDSWVIVY